MRLSRRSWLGLAAAAVCLPLGAASVSHVPQPASGQSEPHGTLRSDTPVPQVRTFYAVPADRTPAPARHKETEPPKDLTPSGAHGGPGEDGKPEHHSGGQVHDPGHGNGDPSHGNGNGNGQNPGDGADGDPAQP